MSDASSAYGLVPGGVLHFLEDVLVVLVGNFVSLRVRAERKFDFQLD